MTVSRRNLCTSPCGRVAVLGVVLWSMLVPHAIASRGEMRHGLQPERFGHGLSGQAASPRETLYQRLGGYDGVASYVALVFPRVAQHPELAHMFRGHGSFSWSSS